MPVAISYSHADSAFALDLTRQIFLRGGHVWIDQCEIVAGESFYDKIQTAFSEASAIIAILSKESVRSVWCKKEIASVMTREISERRIVVVPVLLEDCEVPLFLRDKKYADFRSSFDRGISELMSAIEKFGVANAGRIEAGTGDFHNDYSYETTVSDRKLTLRFLLFQHSSKMPFSIFTEVVFAFNEAATALWMKFNLDGNAPYGELKLIQWACANAEKHSWEVVLGSPKAEKKHWIVTDDEGFECDVEFSCRRLGDETGRMTLVRGNYEFEKIIDLMKTRVQPPEEATD